MGDQSSADGARRPLRILIVHNAYQRYGGEDSVVANEFALLEQAGHSVELLQVSNDAIAGPIASARAAAGTIYSWNGRALVADAIRRFRPDIMHVHNHFPLLSPSIFDASREAGVASVWTLHNYRTTCANGLLFRDGRPCEDCVGRVPISGVVHRCYRGSLAGSAVVSAGIQYHKARGTWRSKVDRYIALSEFARSRHVAGGIPAERISIKPNFGFPPAASDPGPRTGAVFAGRLSPEKGVHTLLEAWRGIDLPLTILGDGPSRSQLERIAPPNVRFAGHVGRQEIHAFFGSAIVAVIPSMVYEQFPMAVIDAFSAGTPVIASRIGAFPEIIEEGKNGKLFRVGDHDDLRSVVLDVISDVDRHDDMRASARDCFDELYSPRVNLASLNSIYYSALDTIGISSKVHHDS